MASKVLFVSSAGNTMTTTKCFGNASIRLILTLILIQISIRELRKQKTDHDSDFGTAKPSLPLVTQGTPVSMEATTRLMQQMLTGFRNTMLATKQLSDVEPCLSMVEVKVQKREDQAAVARKQATVNHQRD
jgi:hypothetical protein